MGNSGATVEWQKSQLNKKRFARFLIQMPISLSMDTIPLSMMEVSYQRSHWLLSHNSRHQAHYQLISVRKGHMHKNWLACQSSEFLFFILIFETLFMTSVLPDLRGIWACAFAQRFIYKWVLKQTDHLLMSAYYEHNWYANCAAHSKAIESWLNMKQC